MISALKAHKAMLGTKPRILSKNGVHFIEVDQGEHYSRQAENSDSKKKALLKSS